MKKFTLIRCLTVAALFLAFLVSNAPLKAQSIPAYDTTFNTYGHIEFSQLHDFTPIGMAVQPDGKVLVYGVGRRYDDDPTFDGFVFRVNTDGSIDFDFATNGILTVDIDGTNDAVYGLAVLPDNKIILLVEGNLRIIFIRLLPNGQYDNSFGNDGVKLGSAVSGEYAQRMVVQPDGKMIVIGYQPVTATKNKGFVRRFNPDGTLDTGYGNNGYVSVVLEPSKTFELYKCILQPDGKLLATGTYGAGAGSGFAVIRLNTDGSYDNDFSGDGIYFNTLGNAGVNAYSEAVAVTSNGNVLVGGNSPLSTNVVMTILSLKPTGAVNAAFGNFGYVKLPIPLFSTVRNFLIQPDGKIIVCGYAFMTNTTTGLIMARLLPNGQVDPTFGPASQAGYFTTFFPYPYDVQVFEHLALAPNGRLHALAWLAENINLSDPNTKNKGVLFRFFMDITIKAEEPSPIFLDAAIMPNPVADNEPVNIRYTLENPCDVSIHLYNIDGREIAWLMPSEHRSAGEQNEKLSLPAGLSPGVYFASLDTEKGTKVIKFIKQ